MWDKSIISEIFSLNSDDKILEHDITDSTFDIIIFKNLYNQQISLFDRIDNFVNAYNKSLTHDKIYTDIFNNYWKSLLLSKYDFINIDPPKKDTILINILFNRNDKYKIDFSNLIKFLNEKEINQLCCDILEVGNYDIIKNTNLFELKEINKNKRLWKVFSSGQDNSNISLVKFFTNYPHEDFLQSTFSRDFIRQITINKENSESILNKLLKFINEIYESNKSYSYIEQTYLQRQKCISPKLLIGILNLLFIIAENNLYNKPINKDLIIDFKFNSKDKINIKLLKLIINGIKISLIPIITSKNVANTRNIEYLYLVSNISNYMNNFLTFYIDSNLYIDDELLNNILHFYHQQIQYTKNIIANNSIINLLINILGNNKDLSHKHNRYAISRLILDIDINHSMKHDYDIEFIKKNILYTHYDKIFEAYLNYFDDINHLELEDLSMNKDNIYLHYRDILEFMSDTIKNNFVDSDKYKVRIFKLVNKIVLNTTRLLDDIINLSKEFIEKSANRPWVSVRMINEHTNYVVNVLSTILKSLKHIYNISFQQKDKISIESYDDTSILHINNLLTSSLIFFKNNENAYHKYFKKTEIQNELIDYSVKSIELFLLNKYFKNILNYNSKEMYELNKYMDLSCINIQKYLEEENDTEIELPDEFIDQILCIPIKSPIMIPSIDIVFDETSIKSHILHEKVNPYTREYLDEDILQKYNNQEDIKAKIDEFKKKLQEYYENNK